MSLPPVEVPSGAMRFNSDSQKLEYWDGAQWLQVSTFSPNLNGGARGVLMGGNPSQNVIQYLTISTSGDTQDFGDLSATKSTGGGLADSTRGLYIGGETPTAQINVIDYITISSTGNAQDFGDVVSGTNAQGIGCIANRTRGVLAGGYSIPAAAKRNTIEYVTIQSTGNTVDFGDLTVARDSPQAVYSSVRGIVIGGNTPTTQNILEFITISTLGNSIDFGDLTTPRSNGGSGGNATRGLIAGGGNGPAYTNSIEFITISALGSFQDFGDLTLSGYGAHGGCSSATRAVWGGWASPAAVDTINSVEIQTTGNALDFGNLLAARNYIANISNAHGGL